MTHEQPALLTPPATDTALPEQGEFSPVTEHSALLRPFQRPICYDSVKLETTGTTSQSRQGELWSKTLILKESILSKLLAIGAVDMAEPLRRCHTEQSFAQCNGCHSVRMFWNRCEVFYCPVCQPALSHERAESIKWWVNEIDQPKHVVVTVRNTEHLSNRYVKWFKSCITKLRRRKFARNWLGGIYSLEVTNEDRGWHLHAHFLVNAGWIDPFKLSSTWADIVGQDYAIVKVKDARQRDYLKEVTKYTVKGTELAKWTPLQIATFIDAFKGVRTFGVFGSLYGLRTKFAEWIKSITTDRRACSCGCLDWTLYTENEWTWKQSTFGPITRPIPPPSGIMPQLQFDGLCSQAVVKH